VTFPQDGMIKRLLYASIILLSLAIPAQANDIYISQVGDTLDLDIVQDGQNNVIGTSVQAVILGATGTASDTMTFSITQTGDTNSIAAQIQGNNYTGTWVFTGDSNTVALMCDSAAAGNCETVTLNITAVGDQQAYTIDIGQSADSDSSTVAFSVTDDGTVMDLDLDGKSAAVNVTVDKNSSVVGTANTFNLDLAGDGDVAGHTMTLDVKGKGNDVLVDQSGVYDNTVNLITVGDNADIDIIQTD
jgi:hypothetical protein|tara:strand:+ start:2158 stop:2892 length:735 start_codon:yes stop_codon:yes gene_type:complete